MDEVLKGNFKVKRPVELKKEDVKSASEQVKDELRQRALTNLGGSMVYVERTQLTWDGEPGDEPKK